MGPRQPHIISFYAYKGGTGRTVALAHTAWALARAGRRVVVIDLDLSAPSLWGLLGPTVEPGCGFVEYLRASIEGEPLRVQELLVDVKLDAKVQGALYLLGAGRMDAAYLETLQSLDWHSLTSPRLRRRRAPEGLFDRATFFDELFDEITDAVEPDAILLDAPTGFNDTANLCLRVLADLVVILFAPTRVQLDGVGKIVSLLLAEQSERQARDQPPRPELLCVASTLMQSRLGGPQFARIQAAFQYLADVRWEALKRPEIRGEAQDLIEQDPAIISYSEVLADIERLATEHEPREGHFAVFQDIIRTVEQVLPPRTSLMGAPIKAEGKAAILEDLKPRFRPFAEQDDTLLDSLFLRTGHVDGAMASRVALVLGGKGSGKTALFRYLSAKHPGDYIPVHGPDVETRLRSDMLCELQDSVASMDVVWRLYALSRVPMADMPKLDGEMDTLLDLMRRLHASPDLLRDIVRRVSTPEIGTRTDHAFRKLDERLLARRASIALCFDGLDAAFKAEVARRDRGISALFSAWQATISSLRHVEFKVFLRTDLWERLSFPEKSHLRGKDLRLNWDSSDIWRLVTKRALASPAFAEECATRLEKPRLDEITVEKAIEKDLYPYLDLLFEERMWAGKTALSRNWIRKRLTDAKEVIYPRDVICLFNEAITVEEKHLLDKDRRTSKTSAISRESLAESITPTSRQRVDALREEYPELQGVLEVLRGRNAQGPLEDLRGWITESVSAAAVADEMIKTLSEAGVVKLGKLDESRSIVSYVIPELYRYGLEMRRPGPR